MSLGFPPFFAIPIDFERLVGLDGTVCRIRLRSNLRLSLAHVRLRAREHFPETKNCISANGALGRRLTVDPSELLDPPVAPGPPRNLHAAGIVSWPAGSPDQE